MNSSRRLCLAVTFTVLIILITSVAVVVAGVFDKTLKDKSEESTEYPILIPKNNSDNQDNSDSEDAIDWEKGFRSCGSATMEACPEPSGEAEESSTAYGNSSQLTNVTSLVRTPTTPGTNDYVTSPNFCHCDKNCTKYGDCCVTVLKRTRNVLEENIWRCSKLLDSRTHSVRMISKCPSYYPDDLNKELCETGKCPKNFANAASLCPLLDVPVINNKTGDLYRSIYCARCHSISKKDSYSPKHELLCSNFTKSGWEDFKKRAVYQQGELSWSDPANSSAYCKLHIADLQPFNIKTLVPNVRFCPNDVKEECSPDLCGEENQTITAKLCWSYMQVIYLRLPSGEHKYKNPHCAKWEHPDIDIKKDPYCFRERLRAQFSPALSTRFTIDTGPVGINILFHFSIDEGYVGYTSKCEEDEILDFIRNKCVPVICPKGYELNDGQCDKILLESSNNHTNISDNKTSNLIEDTEDSSLLANSSEPCFLIILNAGEYHLLPNGSLVVNQSGNSAVVLFEPGEYEKYNRSSMSICAEQVDRTYESSSAPALSTLSNILLALSVIFSLIHVILYIILPKMRNLPGNNLLCLTASLLISQFIFLTLINATNRMMCVMASVTMHYFFLASFFWMNIMSFDIWRTFSSEFLVRRYSGDSFKTFFKYSLFAWVTPLLIVILAVVTDFVQLSDDVMDSEFGPIVKKLRPLYGHNNLCWITQRLSLFVFFALPVALIILCNLVLFTVTATTILLQHREGNRFINGNNNSSNGNKVKSGVVFTSHSGQVGNGKVPLHGCNSSSSKKSDEIRLKLYAKLALIMGMTWTLGFLSAFTKWEWSWYLFVIFNGLQGTFIFVAFDCKLKVWHMVKERCGWAKRQSRKNDTGGEGYSDIKRRTTSTTSTSLGSSTRGELHDHASGNL